MFHTSCTFIAYEKSTILFGEISVEKVKYFWNKKVIGKFKDESPDEVIKSFVGIRSKCYTFKTKNNVVKKAKGVNKVGVKNKN